MRQAQQVQTRVGLLQQRIAPTLRSAPPRCSIHARRKRLPVDQSESANCEIQVERVVHVSLPWPNDDVNGVAPLKSAQHTVKSNSLAAAAINLRDRVAVVDEDLQTHKALL